MSTRFRKYSAYFLLLVYVPVALLINLEREHHCLYIPVLNGHHTAITTYNPHNTSVPDDCLCQACQFVLGHVSPLKFSFFIFQQFYHLSLSDKLKNISHPLRSLPAKRAPPAVFI